MPKGVKGFVAGNLGKRDFSSSVQINRQTGLCTLVIPREIMRKIKWEKKQKVIWMIEDFYGRECLAVIPCEKFESQQNCKKWADKMEAEEEEQEKQEQNQELNKEEISS